MGAEESLQVGVLVCSEVRKTFFDKVRSLTEKKREEKRKKKKNVSQSNNSPLGFFCFFPLFFKKRGVLRCRRFMLTHRRASTRSSPLSHHKTHHSACSTAVQSDAALCRAFEFRRPLCFFFCFCFAPFLSFLPFSFCCLSDRLFLFLSFPIIFPHSHLKTRE